MNLSISFSPCPNDTFIFDALINKKIDTEGLNFEPLLEDVQTLNERVMQGKADISKISYAVLPMVLNNYMVLNSGGALGKGVGPLLIASTPIQKGQNSNNGVDERTIAIPGVNTTAHFLFSLAYPQARKKVFLRFDEIENFVAEGKGLGVIIHENRFTYLQKGLTLVMDLGDYWEQKTGKPIPLGGIVIRKSIDFDTRQKVDRLIRKSLEYSFARYPELTQYVRDHAREMEDRVMLQHIDLYVNNYSLNLQKEGQDAVIVMLKTITGKSYEKSDVFLQHTKDTQSAR